MLRSGLMFLMLLLVVSCVTVRTETSVTSVATDCSISGDDAISVMVIPRAEKRFAVGSLIARMNGTGAAWDRDKGMITLTDMQDEELGFCLVKELETQEMNIGFSENDVDKYLSFMAEHEVEGSFVFTCAGYPVDVDAVVDWSNLDLERYTVVKMSRIDKSSDRMMMIYRVEEDLAKPLKARKDRAGDR